MLTVSEAAAALAGAPADAKCYLPGGAPLQQVQVRDDGIWFSGDEEARGTEQERTAAAGLQDYLTAAGVHPDKVEAVAWDLVAAGATGAPVADAASAPDPAAEAPAPDGNVTITPKGEGILNVSANPMSRPTVHSSTNWQIINYDGGGNDDVFAIGNNLNATGGTLVGGVGKVWWGQETNYSYSGAPVMEQYMRFTSPDGLINTEPFYAQMILGTGKLGKTFLRGAEIHFEDSDGNHIADITVKNQRFLGFLDADGNLNSISATPSSSSGLHFGYNYSGGNAEGNLVLGTGIASTQYILFSAWNGTTMTEMGRLTGTGNFSAKGVLIAGSTPTTITDSAGKILSAALNTVGVAQGGTGATTLTSGSIITGNGTGNVTFIAPGTGITTALANNVRGTGNIVLAAAATDGQVLIGTTSTGNYTPATLTAGNGVTITNAAGSVTINATGSGNVTGSSLTANAIIVGNGTNSVGALAALGSSGNVLISAGAGAPPSFTTINLATANSVGSSILPVANGGTNLSSGTSGGILGYTASGTLASSAALASGNIVIGGGAGRRQLRSQPTRRPRPPSASPRLVRGISFSTKLHSTHRRQIIL